MMETTSTNEEREGENIEEQSASEPTADQEVQTKPDVDEEFQKRIDEARAKTQSDKTKTDNSEGKPSGLVAEQSPKDMPEKGEEEAYDPTSVEARLNERLALLACHNMDQFNKLMNAIDGSSGDQIIERIGKGDDIAMAAFKAFRTFESIMYHRRNADFEAGTLRELAEADDDTEFGDIKVGEFMEPNRHDRVSHKLPKSKSENGRASAQWEENAVVAATQGFIKVHLYNSGFWVRLKPPTNAQLNQFYNTVDLESNELGYSYGSLYFLTADVFLKRQLADFLPALVVHSNLSGWSRGTTLIDCLSFHDYRTIVWALVYLMYNKQGITIPLQCISDECKFVDYDQVIDPYTMRLDYLKDRISEDDIEYVRANEERSMEEVVGYQSRIKGMTEDVKTSRGEYHLRVPTFGHWLRCNEDLINKMLSRVDQVRGDRETYQLTDYMRHYVQMLIPWISSAKIPSEDGEDIVVSSVSGIAATMDFGTEDDEEVFEKISSFIGRTAISHFCYAPIECPECGALPINGSGDGYVPVDIEYYFFILACRKINAEAV